MSMPSESFAAHLVAHHDEAVVAHLFRVASSLESLVLGEGQILGQVRDAYQAAVARGAVGPIFHDLFQNAIRVGKKVRSETGLDQGKLSVASVAVDVARRGLRPLRRQDRARHRRRQDGRPDLAAPRRR